MSGETGEEVDAGRVAVEREARELGWSPKDQWRGDPAQWRDADEFLQRGREILPIVNAQNRRLLTELSEAKNQLAALKGTVTQQSQTVKDLLEHQATEIKRQVEDRLKDLRADKRAAIKEGDHDRAADIEDQIDATRDALAEANKPKPTPAEPAKEEATSYEPWAVEFGQANEDWLGKDKRKTALFGAICEDLFANSTLRAGALLAKAKEEMEATLGEKRAPAAKSEGGSGGWSGSSGGGGSKGGKAYNDLPADAKEVCKSQAKKFVGESGKAFKTEGEWQAHYASTYFASLNKE